MPKLRIFVLGGLEIDGGHGTPLTRKASAVTAFLALNIGQPQSRDRLAALFWENSPAEQARANVRQCLSAMRKYFGQALISEQDHVALEGVAVDFDAHRFEELASADDLEQLEEAAAIYKGDLLEGFNIKEEAFEAWIRPERERYRNLMIAALIKLVDLYQASQNTGSLAKASTHLLALDPLNEDVHRILMRAYTAQGRQALALKQFESCRDILKRELGVNPEPETVSLYRDIRQQRAKGTDTEAETELRQNTEGPPLPDGPSVVVLPFENKSGDLEQDYFAAGITENIITGLTRFRDFLVIGVSSSFAARDRKLEVQQIGRQLGVRHVIEGSVRNNTNSVRVTVQLIDAENGHRIWAEQYDRDMDDIFSVQDDITKVVVATIAGRIEKVGLFNEEHSVARDMTAYDYWLRGRHCLNQYTKDGLLEARCHFERAIEMEPHYARAYADLARSHLYEYEASWSESPLVALDNCYQLAQKAVEFDDSDSTARYALAWAYACQNQLELAMVQIEKAINLNPNDYHNLCAKSYFLALSGKLTEGITCSNEAMRLNPFATDACLFAIGIGEFGANQYERAIRAFGEVTSYVPLWRAAYLAACFAYLGLNEQAQAKAAEVLELAKTEVVEPLGTDAERWRRYWSKWYLFQNAGALEHFLQGLRKAGLPA